MRLLMVFGWCASFFFGWFYTQNGVRGQCPSGATNIVVKQGFRLYGHVINWLYAEQEVLCRLKCNMIDGCLTINYETATKICELNDANHTLHINHLRQTQGFVYVDLQKKTTKSEVATAAPPDIFKESPIRSDGDYCVQPKSGDCNPVENKESNTLILKSADKNCSAEFMKFIFGSDGVIRHKCSGKIVCPDGNYPSNSRLLLLLDACPKDVSMHRRLPSKSLQNIVNSACVHPKGGRALENVNLVYHHGCDQSRLVLDFFELPSVK